MSRKIRALIVDDSATMRAFLKATLGADDEIEVVGTAADPYAGRELLVKHRPDVMTLDLDMPRMDGLSFLTKVMEHLPTRTLIVSGVSPQGSANALKALELGAIDVVEKPVATDPEDMKRWSAAIVAKIKGIATARLPTQVEGRHEDKANAPQIVAIAASTGGTEALRTVLRALPPGLPPIVIVQHMPPVFTRVFTEGLQKICPYEIREARDGERLQPGVALLAPGDFHLELVGRAPTPAVRLHQAPQLHGVRPAADLMFRSVAKIFGNRALGVILTGMGRDGADGLAEMRKAGAHTIGQSEATCVVYGMPRAAQEAGAVARILDLDRIAQAITQRAG